MAKINCIKCEDMVADDNSKFEGARIQLDFTWASIFDESIYEDKETQIFAYICDKCLKFLFSKELITAKKIRVSSKQEDLGPIEYSDSLIN